MKMEEAIRKIDGVDSANINFMLQKLTLEANEEDFEEIIKKARVAIKDIDDEAIIL